MSFQESIITCLRKYASFGGRARRSEYWWFALFTTIAGAAVSGFGDGAETLVSAVFFLPGLAVWVRRLHDVGRSGWSTLWVFLPVIGWIMLFVWSVRAGDPGDNRYGPAPA